MEKKILFVLWLITLVISFIVLSDEVDKRHMVEKQNELLREMVNKYEQELNQVPYIIESRCKNNETEQRIN